MLARYRVTERQRLSEIERQLRVTENCYESLRRWREEAQDQCAQAMAEIKSLKAERAALLRIAPTSATWRERTARKTVAQVCAVTGASIRSVERAKRIKRLAPDLFEQVQRGEMKLAPAERLALARQHGHEDKDMP